MADRKLYIAPTQRLRPNPEGYAAYETMGRRIGALYNEAGQDYRRIGELQAREITDRRWPLDILALEQASRQRGGGFRTRGLSDYGAHDQIAAGMGAIGAALGYPGPNAVGAGAGDVEYDLYHPVAPGGGELIDLTTGTTMFGRDKSVAGTHGGGLIDVGGGPTSTGSTFDLPAGAAPSDLGVLPGNAIVRETLPGSVDSSYSAPLSGWQYSGKSDLTGHAPVADSGYQQAPGGTNDYGFNGQAPPPSTFMQSLGNWLGSFGAAAEATSGFE